MISLRPTPFGIGLHECLSSGRFITPTGETIWRGAISSIIQGPDSRRLPLHPEQELQIVSRCGQQLLSRAVIVVANGVVSARAVAPGVWWRKPGTGMLPAWRAEDAPPRTWSITSSPGYRCGTGCSRFPSRCACCSRRTPSCSRRSCRSSTSVVAHVSDQTSRTQARRSRRAAPSR